MEDNLTCADPRSYRTNGSRVGQVSFVSVSVSATINHFKYAPSEICGPNSNSKRQKMILNE